MHRLSFHYTLQEPTGTPATAPETAAVAIRNPLMDLLLAVGQCGSISGAARQLGLSYRHVWGELKRWQDVLGAELVNWDKGQPARLSPYAAKLLWAERQAQARLAPQIEALQAELERSFALARDPQLQVLTLFASHDETLSALRDHAARESDPAVHLDVRFMGSLDAIRALNEGRCTLAGFHTLAPAPKGQATERAYKRLLQPGQHKIIGLARRQQGLLVTPGNPLGLTSLADAVHTQARFAQRSAGSGTRVVLQELLAASGLAAHRLNACGLEEPSQAAVAQAVASGHCDCALGTAANAARAGLGFVPLAQECLHLVCLKSVLDEPPLRGLRTLLATDRWQAWVAQVPGCQPEHSGRVLSLNQQLPWWRFARPRSAQPPA